MFNTRSTAVVMLTAGLACAVTPLERAAASENPAAGLDLAPSRHLRVSSSPARAASPARRCRSRPLDDPVSGHHLAGE